jgi:ribosome biogenesis protein UTP30
MDIPLVQRVIEYSKIEKKFPTYTDKRKLFYEYDLFFCDQTIYPLLAKATGKKFYESKKYK